MNRPQRFVSLAGLVVLLSLILAACQGGAGGASSTLPSTMTMLPAASSTVEASTANATQPVPTGTLTLTPEPSSTVTVGPSSTPTADLRLNPEDWREWPVVPDRVSDFARQIYQQGLAMGNDSHSFSKVGDCQAIREVLMGIYDKPGWYTLRDGQSYLKETINQFAGSFNRDGEGVKGGYNAAAVLSPMWADPKVCQPGETPIECEYRIHKPSIVIISLEVWWDGRTPARYEQYMRKIIDFYISHGVVPILSTKADNVEGDHAINAITARLAYEYDLPLWNWWLEAQSLPNRGLDPTRPDGFHISYAAWTPRSRTALESLDAVWRMLNDQSVPLPEPTMTPTPTITPKPTIEANLIGPAREMNYEPDPFSPDSPPGLLIGLGLRKGEALTREGVYRVDLVEGGPTRVMDSSVIFQDVSPGGRYLLAGRLSDLYFIAGKDWVTASNEWVEGENTARFTPDGSGMVYIEQKPGEKRQLIFRSFDGSDPSTLNTGNLTPGSIAAVTKDAVYWYEDCGATCDPEGLWVSPLNGATIKEVGTFRRAKISPDEAWMAYLEPGADGKDRLGVVSLLNGERHSVEMLKGGDAWVDFTWGPDSRTLSALLAKRSDYSGKVLGNIHLLVIVPTMNVSQLPELEGLNARLLFAPDGKTVFRAATITDTKGSHIAVDQVELASKQVAQLKIALADENFIWAETLEYAPVLTTK